MSELTNNENMTFTGCCGSCPHPMHLGPCNGLYFYDRPGGVPGNASCRCGHVEKAAPEATITIYCQSCDNLTAKLVAAQKEAQENWQSVKRLKEELATELDGKKRLNSEYAKLRNALVECAVPLEALHSVEQWKPMLSPDMRAQIAVAVGQIRGALAMKEQG